MVIYFKLGKIRGLSFNFDKEFGFLPLIAFHKNHGELFFDLPYCRIIYTPKGWAFYKNRRKEK